MGSLRDAAIEALGVLLLDVRNGNPPSRTKGEAVIDAIIAAARAPESEHTRALEEQQLRKQPDRC